MSAGRERHIWYPGEGRKVSHDISVQSLVVPRTQMSVPRQSFHRCRDGVIFVQVPASLFPVYDVPAYWMDDIRKEDTVLDIGANMGAFCIRAARRNRSIVAVEPVTEDLLQENTRLNGVEVKVIPVGLGDGRPSWIQWGTRSVYTRTYPLQELITLAGGCDFLKCDCEGAEWFIEPEDLAGIRRIEMELHQPPIGPLPNPQLLEYLGRHFAFVIDRIPVHSPLGQLGILHAWRR